MPLSGGEEPGTEVPRVGAARSQADQRRLVLLGQRLAVKVAPDRRGDLIAASTSS